MMKKRQEIRLCGYGGQGIILAGHIIGQAVAIYEHKYATFIQDYGPEARGGSTRADVVVSNDRVLYPYIETPTVLVAMSQPAYEKYNHLNHQDALVIIDEDLVKPTAVKGSKVAAIPATRIAEKLGRANAANTVMLGFFTAVTGIVSAKAMKQAISASVPRNTIELNEKAFDEGYNYAKQHPVSK